jgi:hypothetical protein
LTEVGAETSGSRPAAATPASAVISVKIVVPSPVQPRGAGRPKLMPDRALRVEAFPRANACSYPMTMSNAAAFDLDAANEALAFISAIR